MLHQIKPFKGARKTVKRLGRGCGSGTGKTSGKGHKGQLARSGGGVRPGFEGGQIPFFQRIPKRGFHNINQKKYSIVNLGALEILENNTLVNQELLLEKKIIKSILPNGVKILSKGKLTKKLNFKVSKYSKKAQENIKLVGGNIEVN
ncbi:50S ribosomal protein L15 [Candidatus Phytoplasma mali]|uniref:Large ribosomal subunit protein uL15 n=1 Tax=Phytoplasma mali (strain AT) TaxID=482235 RepID=RL15_PHYMT|nr:RecName: Full=Large ribosomal subunit protein uL15; AltName: Full=50S ribosomal protein L15 [Candidatus Phytoplasma mali AT]CAP18547.1 50S ribosomal protein L15 [Candidatus Phytoplasma mali]